MAKKEIKIEDILKNDEQIVFANGDLFAKNKNTKEKKNLNNLGCDLIIALDNRIKDNLKEIKELENKINELRRFNRNLYVDKGQLFKNGFCDKTERAYKKDSLTNQIIGEFRTHEKGCRNENLEGVE